MVKGISLAARLFFFLFVAGALKAADLSNTNDAAAAVIAREWQPVVNSINDKIANGYSSAFEFGPELKRIDALIEKHKPEKTDPAAQLVFHKALLYFQVFHDETTGVKILAQITNDFPDTITAKGAAQVIAEMNASAAVHAEDLKKAAAAARVRETLQIGTPFPDFTETNSTGERIALSQYKGKVLLVYFWATWNSPCVVELPNVSAMYQKYHNRGFEVVMISLDQDKAELDKFFATNEKMPWQQYFDGLGWKNKLAVKYGVMSIPASYLIDRQGHIFAKNMLGPELEEAVLKALDAE